MIEFTNGLITGTWLNPRTNEKIIVRDCVFEDNELVVITTSGKKYSYDQFQNFTQISTSMKEEPRTIQTPAYISESNNRNNNISSVYKSKDSEFNINDDFYDLPEDENIMTRGLSTIHTPVPQEPEWRKSILTVLDKLEDDEIPKIKYDIVWNEIPEAIKFLQKYMNIEEEQIVDCIIQKFVDLDKIKDDLEKQIKSKFEREPAEVIPNTKPKPKPKKSKS